MLHRTSRFVCAACLALVFAGLPLTPALAIERAIWIRYPAISPDGKTIAFGWRGNLWKVSASGGVATPLTVGASYNSMPVWSDDGSKLAFASDRNGNFDVYVMPAEGGEATRLTFHSADEVPTSFTHDGKSVLFSASVMPSVTCVAFPTPAQPQLYEVGLDAGMPVMLLTTPALFARYDHAGKRVAYSDEPGYEMEWRQHDRSAFARQVWLWDPAANRHTRLTQPGADNRDPVWAPDDRSLFYLSEASGSFNVWRLDLADPAHPVPITHHTRYPVRFLSISAAGDLCYGLDGDIWVRPAGASESHRIDVLVATDRRTRTVVPADVGGQITEFDVSPDGSEVAFAARGEVFVTSTEHGDTRRLTDTPEQERSVRFSPDGRSLLYASERDGRWRLYRTDLTDKDEPNFFNATALRETLVVGGEFEAFQPEYSPDGREIAYLENRTTLKVLNLASGRTRTVLPGDYNYSYTDGDQAYDWSPDGKWIAVQYLSHDRWSSEVGLVPASGEGKVIDVTNSGYEDGSPHWSRKGEVLYWQTDRQGLRAQRGDGRQTDVYAAFLTRKAWDRWKLDEAAYDQLVAKEKEKDKEKGGEKPGGKEGKVAGEAEKLAPKLAEPVAIDFDHLEDRTARVSLASADLSTALLSPDGETLYYLARYDKGFDLWKYAPRSHEIKLVAKFGARAADFQLDRPGKKAVVLADGRLTSVELESGKTTPIALNAHMDLNEGAERAYMFEHIWRQTFEKFLDPGMHAVDWKAAKEHYQRFLPAIDNARDFAEMASEMQGELNASHTGCRYRPTRPDGDQTAALGFFADPAWTGPGVAIAEVIEGGPLQQAGTRIRAGDVITAIDGAPIRAGACWYPLLDHKADTPVRLALLAPRGGARWEESARPISWADQARLLYQRWWRARRDEVTRLSGGRLGYAHIRGMDEGSYRELYDEVFGRDLDRDGIVLDTRFNGGGNLVEALTTFLTGRQYATNAPRGQVLGHEPSNRWTKPSIVVMNQGNYSDAHCFPMAYTQLGIGKTVGMPVPGTCSSVWWERLQDRDLVFGIPEVALLDIHGEVMENHQLDPDYLVEPDPAQLAAGHDQQLERAIEALLGQLPKR